MRQDAAEACIALSLALAALELARRGLQEHELDDRRPASLPVLAFGFGLVRPHPRRKSSEGSPRAPNSHELSLSPAPSHEIPRVLWAADEGQ